LVFISTCFSSKQQAKSYKNAERQLVACGLFLVPTKLEKNRLWKNAVIFKKY